jgi:hypothetical protein
MLCLIVLLGRRCRMLIPAVRACNVVQHKPFDGREANRPDLLSNHDILKAGVAVSTVQKSI